jgi:carbonic anhydrase
LRTGIGGTAAGLLTGAGIEFAAPRSALAQSKLTPDAALQALMDGNQRFVERRLTLYEADLTILKQNTAEKQEPVGAAASRLSADRRARAARRRGLGSA